MDYTAGMTEPDDSWHDGRRATRRHHKARMKRRAVAVRPHAPGAVKLADHMANCSCFMCGHMRRWQGPTLQERRAFQPDGRHQPADE